MQIALSIGGIMAMIVTATPGVCGTTDHLKILVEAKTREREVVHLP
jgi:hypothetical protein